EAVKEQQSNKGCMWRSKKRALSQKEIGTSRTVVTGSMRNEGGYPARAISIRKGTEEGLHLVGELGGVRQSLPDLIAKQFAVTTAQAVDGDSHRAFGHSEVRGDLRIRDIAFAGGEEGLEFI